MTMWLINDEEWCKQVNDNVIDDGQWCKLVNDNVIYWGVSEWQIMVIEGTVGITSMGWVQYVNK